MTRKEAFEQLKAWSKMLDKVEYDQITALFSILGKMPIAITRMPPGTPIDRVRKNNGETLFTRVDELSYIKDQNVIDKYLTEFGRANRPHDPMFYGSVESTRIGHQRIVALAETSVLYQDEHGVNLEGELYTVSRWKNTQELFLAEMVFSQDAINTNPDTKRAFGKQSAWLKEQARPADVDFYLEYIVFISDQFARSKQTHHDYKISTAYAQFVIERAGFHGVAFPSVQTKYQGQNLVLTPKVVDTFLVVDRLATVRFHKNGLKMVLNNYKNCPNPADCMDDLQWVDVDPQYISSKEEVLASLGNV